MHAFRISLTLALFLLIGSYSTGQDVVTGVAELETLDDQITLVTGFVEVTAGLESEVLVEFEDEHCVFGYSTALINTSSGELLSITDTNFDGAAADSLKLKLYSVGAGELVGVVHCIGEPTTGTTTEPLCPPNPTAPAPAMPTGNAPSQSEQDVAIVLARLGYKPFVHEPGREPGFPTAEDPCYQPGGPYHGTNPDFRIQGVIPMRQTLHQKLIAS